MVLEDQDILAKISQLAGQINRHKNGQLPDQQTQFHPPPRTQTYPSYPQTDSTYRPSRGGYPSARGHPRGGRAPQVHRHRTLVLNGSGSTDATPNRDEQDSLAKLPAPSSAWVSKTDRHMQLINTSVYEKDSQTRAKAIEETRKQKLKHRDERERNKFNKHMQREASNIYAPGRSSTSEGNYEVIIQGIRFRVTKNGSKLVKVPGEDSHATVTPEQTGLDVISYLPYLGDVNAAKSTPRTHIIHGVKFHRSTNGNMYRAGIIKAYRYGRPIVRCLTIESTNGANLIRLRRNGVVKKINEPCKIFATSGSCPKGPRCRYVHDPSKVAICKEFLQKGSCPSGDSCDLSHELTPERTPTCLHFAKGNCSNPNCRYSHVRVSPAALVCRPFGIYGYCEKGSGCQERHVHECPDFSNTGTCTTKGCKLLHRHKASVMRSNTAPGDPIAAGENSDISSDEEDEEIDSEDVDSDDLDEEFFGDDDGKTDTDIPTQQDYVGLQ